MMGRIWFCLNVFNEEQLLPECLESIRRYHPDAPIVAVDGAYQSFVDENKKLIAQAISQGHPEVADQMERFILPASSDKTLEILRYCKVDKIIECERVGGLPVPWAHEYTKRSKYFVGQDGDYYFVVDADERLTKRLDFESLTKLSYNIKIHRDERNTVPYSVMRVHKHADGMRYDGAHHVLWYGDVIWRREMCEDLDFTLEHRVEYRALRDPLRHLAKGQYYRYLTTVEESAFRTQNGFF